MVMVIAAFDIFEPRHTIVATNTSISTTLLKFIFARLYSVVYMADIYLQVKYDVIGYHAIVGRSKPNVYFVQRCKYV